MLVGLATQQVSGQDLGSIPAALGDRLGRNIVSKLGLGRAVSLDLTSFTVRDDDVVESLRPWAKLLGCCLHCFDVIGRKQGF